MSVNYIGCFQQIVWVIIWVNLGDLVKQILNSKKYEFYKPDDDVPHCPTWSHSSQFKFKYLPNAPEEPQPPSPPGSSQQSTDLLTPVSTAEPLSLSLSLSLSLH